eukprot:scaffold19867_cov56-Phaeocystis_antarctica.AAC.6
MFSESFSKGVGLYNNTSQPLSDRQPHCKLARAKARVKIDSLYDKYRRENEDPHSPPVSHIERARARAHARLLPYINNPPRTHTPKPRRRDTYRYSSGARGLARSCAGLGESRRLTRAPARRLDRACRCSPELGRFWNGPAGVKASRALAARAVRPWAASGARKAAEGAKTPPGPASMKPVTDELPRLSTPRSPATGSSAPSWGWAAHPVAPTPQPLWTWRPQPCRVPVARAGRVRATAA